MNATPRIAKEPKLLKDHAVLLLTCSCKTPGHPTTEFLYLEEVHHRAETMTPLLQELLDFRPTPSLELEH
jgi:hypothetical protein